jgi:hypothetical protein
LAVEAVVPSLLDRLATLLVRLLVRHLLNVYRIYLNNVE